MTIRSKSDFSNTYLNSSGQWLDNTTGDITPTRLRAGIRDYFDSQTAFWPLDSSGIIGSDSVSGLFGVDFSSGIADPSWKEGRVFYDLTNHTFAVYNDKPDVTLQLGQETHIRAVNKTGSTIPNGTAVSINGAQGNRPTFEPAIASKTYQYRRCIIGVTTHESAPNEETLITVEGTVGMNTSSFGDGSGLFLSSTTSGEMTITRPVAPTPAIQIGYALNSTVNGKILVHVHEHTILEDLDNVDGTVASHGYILNYNNTSGYWDPTDRINTSGGFKIGDVSSNNYTEFQENTGFPINHGSGRAWDDLRIPGETVGAGASAPDRINFVNTSGIQVYGFDGGVTSETIFFSCQIPHNSIANPILRPHVHWTPTTNATGYVKWFLQYTWSDINSIFTSPITVSGIGLASGAAWKHTLTEFPDISGAGSRVSSMLMCRMYRTPTDSQDTYPDDAAFLEFDFHYLIDSNGSRSEYIK